MSEKATRDSFGETLRALGAEMPELVVLDADLSVSTKSALFAKEFPARFFQMGIAECNMIGTAAGLAFTGYVPFICSFGAFVAGRYETIRVSVGYSKANVKIVGTHAGLGTGEDGYTQMGLEDIAILRSLPGMTILQPCDHVSTAAAVRYAAKTNGPFYLRLTRQKLPAVYSTSETFEFGKAKILKQGEQVALLATGGTVGETLKAAESLGHVKPYVVDFHTIKPIDVDVIKMLAAKCKTIITIEDHNVIGGLGSAVAEQLVECGFAGRMHRIGVGEEYGVSGTPAGLYEHFGLSAPKLVERFKKILG
jgi:transketolase